MSKDAVLKMLLAPLLRADLMAEAEAAHQPASHVVNEPVRELVQRQRNARACDGSLHADVCRSNDKVDAGAVPRRSGEART